MVAIAVFGRAIAIIEDIHGYLWQRYMRHKKLFVSVIYIRAVIAK
jgi:hypothetical protein